MRLGKLPIAIDLVRDFTAYLDQARFETLPVSTEHGIRAGLLPGPHKDPFDRILIAQALAENLSIVSNDEHLDGYGAKRVW